MMSRSLLLVVALTVLVSAVSLKGSMQPSSDDGDGEPTLYEHPPIIAGADINPIEQSKEIGYLVSLFDQEPLAATPGGTHVVSDCNQAMTLEDELLKGDLKQEIPVTRMDEVRKLTEVMRATPQAAIQPAMQANATDIDINSLVDKTVDGILNGVSLDDLNAQAGGEAAASAEPAAAALLQ
mmetsp:Transcript_15034/g.29555  ORF Transcript_15034/g.29555 Transcript_15034/m.29555 type:complete len:181 (+) Transcript_15034:16-558(+)